MPNRVVLPFSFSVPHLMLPLFHRLSSLDLEVRVELVSLLTYLRCILVLLVLVVMLTTTSRARPPRHPNH